MNLFEPCNDQCQNNPNWIHFLKQYHNLAAEVRSSSNFNHAQFNNQPDQVWTLKQEWMIMLNISEWSTNLDEKYEIGQN